MEQDLSLFKTVKISHNIAPAVIQYALAAFATPLKDYNEKNKGSKMEG
jgi:hypothetical protein